MNETKSVNITVNWRRSVNAEIGEVATIWGVKKSVSFQLPRTLPGACGGAVGVVGSRVKGSAGLEVVGGPASAGATLLRSDAPHSEQNFAFAEFSLWHCVHFLTST